MPLRILTSVLAPLLCPSTLASGPTVDGRVCVGGCVCVHVCLCVCVCVLTVDVK